MCVCVWCVCELASQPSSSGWPGQWLTCPESPVLSTQLAHLACWPCRIVPPQACQKKSSDVWPEWFRWDFQYLDICKTSVSMREPSTEETWLAVDSDVLVNTAARWKSVGLSECFPCLLWRAKQHRCQWEESSQDELRCSNGALLLLLFYSSWLFWDAHFCRKTIFRLVLCFVTLAKINGMVNTSSNKGIKMGSTVYNPEETLNLNKTVTSNVYNYSTASKHWHARYQVSLAYNVWFQSWIHPVQPHLYSRTLITI